MGATAGLPRSVIWRVFRGFRTAGQASSGTHVGLFEPLGIVSGRMIKCGDVQLDYVEQWIDDANWSIELAVIQVLGVQGICPKGFGGCKNSTVPVGNLVANAKFDGNRHKGADSRKLPFLP